jgi:hypothetical protein
MKTLLALAASAALLAVAGQAAATEYVVNGGFETDDTTGWTETGAFDPGFNYVSTDGHNSNFEFHEGNFANDGVAGLSQVLGTTSGAAYDISLWFHDTGGNGPGGDLLQVLWNGVVVGQVADAPFSAVYSQLVFHVTGAGADQLTVQGYSSAGYNFIDDISVVEGTRVISGPGEPGSVPEPASWALMLTGFFGLGSVLRRQRGAALAA